MQTTNHDDGPPRALRGLFYGLLFASVIWLAMVFAGRYVFVSIWR